MGSLRRRGVRVHEDVCVVGIDGHPLAELADLTTVRQPAHEQGRIAARMVLTQLDGPSDADATTTAVTVPTGLVVRTSTGPPR
jgi:DNA-binding LacI/PurR family transcriptional regulator